LRDLNPATSGVKNFLIQFSNSKCNYNVARYGPMRRSPVFI